MTHRLVYHPYYLLEEGYILACICLSVLTMLKEDYYIVYLSVCLSVSYFIMQKVLIGSS